MNQRVVIGKWKAAACVNQDGKFVDKKLPFTFNLKENGSGVMKFLFVPFACTWECDGNFVTVHMKDKDVKLMVAEDQLVLEGQNHEKAFFRKAA